jgi:hypothetical protein
VSLIRRTRSTLLWAATGMAFAWFGSMSTVDAALAQVGANPDGLAVAGPDVTVAVAPQGGIESVAFADGRVWDLGGRSLLTADVAASSVDRCDPDGDAAATSDGGVEWRTRCVDDTGRVSFLTERLWPADSSIAWTVRVDGSGDSYSKGIWTRLSGWQDDETRLFWTTWSTSPFTGSGTPAWSDPLRPAPFANRELRYSDFRAGNGFTVPMATIVEPGTDHGLSLVQSLDDRILDARLRTAADGTIELGRFRNRLSGDQSITFRMDLVASEADWRPALGWTAARYRDHFRATTDEVDNLAGLGTYSHFPGPFGPSLRDRLDAQAYRTNWELSLRGPYQGLFMPPVESATEEWPSFLGGNFWLGPPETESVSGWRKVLDYWTDAGFENLGYFNANLFGAYITGERPGNYACDDPDRWKDANDYLHCDFPGAFVRDAAGNPVTNWFGGAAMDPGDPAYRRHLVDQARLLLQRLPQYRGIAIDQLDQNTRFNTYADDGVSWYNGAPARSGVTSWKALARELTAVVHGMGKQVWVNPSRIGKRIDWMRGIDGIFSEFNQGGPYMNLDAFLGLERPVIGWTDNLGSNPDAYIQRYLYMGVYPLSDSPRNDHAIRTSDTVGRYYEDYGPMFAALRGKRWVYAPHAVRVTAGTALANVFSVDGGIVIPVMQGGSDAQARVAIGNLQRIKPGLDPSRVEYIQPGDDEWRPLEVVREGAGVTADVPLSRGAAMVRIRSYNSDIAPARGELELDLASSSASVAPSQPQTVTATLRNRSSSALTDVSAALSVPGGWSAERIGSGPDVLAPGATATVRWRLTASPAAVGTVGEVRGTVTYQQAGQTGTVSDAFRLTAGELVPRTDITATASSAGPAYPAANAVDGDERTTWRTASGVSAPHSITLDLQSARNLAGITYLPRQDGEVEGIVGQYRVSVSVDGTSFEKVADGSWRFDAGLRAASFRADGVRYVRFEAVSSGCTAAATAELNVIAGTSASEAPQSVPSGTPDAPQQFSNVVPKDGMTVTASSQQPGFEATKAIDGDVLCTFWHTRYSPYEPLPQSLTLDLGREYDTSGLAYTPRQDHQNGMVTEYEISASQDGQTFTPVATGQWALDRTVKYVRWAATPARYVRLTAIKGFNSAGGSGPGGYATAANLDVGFEPRAGSVEVEVPRFVEAGGSGAVTVTFRNQSQATATGVELSLSVPSGWRAEPETATSAGEVAAGGTFAARWRIEAPADAEPGSSELVGRATFAVLGQSHTAEDSDATAIPPSPPSGTVYLSDQEWLEATNGYDTIKRDTNFFGQPLTIEGEVFEHGFWTNAPSSMSFYLGENCSRFTAAVGIDDSMEAYGADRGSVVFQVFADGEKVYDSGLVLGATVAPPVEVDLTRVEELRLVATDGGDGISYDHAVWADPLVTCAA